MEELYTLREMLLKGDISSALLIVEQLQEINRDQKISDMRPEAVTLLLTLIKQQVEGRCNRFGDLTMRNAVRAIITKNKRRKSKTYYLLDDDLRLAIEEAYVEAVDWAAMEIQEGRYQPEELSRLLQPALIIDQAMELIRQEVIGNRE
jgi:hypothetical protein